MRAEVGTGKPGNSSTPLPPQKGPSARVSHPIWICNEMIASSRNLAAFSLNATARKSHWSKDLTDETIPISQ